MSSNINPNVIDASYPVAGQDNNTQGFRDNFAGIKQNFTYAEAEINALQNNTANIAASNDFDNNLIYDLQIKEVSLPVNTANILANVATLSFNGSHYWNLSDTSANASTTLAFTGWPAAGQYAQMTLEFDVGNTSRSYELPANVTIGNVGVTGLSGTTLNFATTGTYQFTFASRDNGSSIILTENNSKLKPFNNSSEDLDNAAAADLGVTTSYFSTGGAETATLAAGVEGQIKVFAMKADSGDMVITVSNAGWKSSGTGTITFDTIGDSCILQYVSSKWFCIGNNGAAFA